MTMPIRSTAHTPLAVSLGASLCGSVAQAQDEMREAPTEDSAVAPPSSPSMPTARGGAQEPVAEAETATFEPTTASYSLNEPTFNNETTHRRVPNVPLLATGAVVLAGSYLPAVVGGAISDRRGDDNLYIPVAGPFLALTRGEDESAGYRTLFIVDGIAQGLGGLGMLLSFLIPEKVTERWYLIGQNDSVRIAPGRVATGYGLSANGRF